MEFSSHSDTTRSQLKISRSLWFPERELSPLRVLLLSTCDKDMGVKVLQPSHDYEAKGSSDAEKEEPGTLEQ